ncbi:MAG: NifB/NifX family molybdenum-iron cluster-binding protein [Solobacterium sp.]|nr:NifB/NifX family molybdenum-iron cluster-binding protein [Solobacterium sp.]MBQ6532856.1 NifB/NifX family molybdenum-iron cluster-binding protein [Solobacterium sp.]MBR0213517.1 NifB/NifX family molybdenum-iron cluster-binding protein [Solobacterium sp.]
MIVAVTYENDQVFQHFGKTQKFEFYTVEDGKITGSEVVGTNGVGHHDLAPWLAERGVEAVVCGGIGTGMIQALQACGIAIFAGASGSTEEAVHEFLRGGLETVTGSNCGKHDC